MKIRTCFVSNSSSSSFCLYGIYLNQYEFEEYFKEPIDKDLNDDFNYVLDGFYQNNIEVIQNNEEVYIGRSLKNCPDDITMGDFKQEIKEKIKSLSEVEISDKSFDVLEFVIDDY